MIRRDSCLLGWFLLLFVVGGVPAIADQTRPSVELTEVSSEERGARVSFEIRDGVSEELLERIESGTPVTFRHRIELFARRPFPIPNLVLGRATIDTRVEYDTLTRQFALLRTIRFRGRKKSPLPTIEDRETTESREQMVDWMTRVSDVNIDDAGSERFQGSRRVRVTSNLGRRYVMWIFPASLSVSAERPIQP